MRDTPRFSEREIAERQAAVARVFVDHAQLECIRNHLDRLMHQRSVGTSARLTLLLANTGCGKTSAIQDFLAQSEGDFRTKALYVSLPVPCTIKAMTSEMLRQLGDPLCDRNTTASRNSFRIIHQLKQQGKLLLIIDEFQHLIDHDRDKVQRQTTDWLKTLLDRAGVPVVCVGLPNSLEIIRSNSQLERRTTKVIYLPAFIWDNGEQTTRFRVFLHVYESALPFTAPSNLSALPMAAALHRASDGLVGRISQLIGEATLVSMTRADGQDCLTWKDFAAAYAGLPFANRNPFDPEAICAHVDSGERRAVSNRGRQRSSNPGLIL